MPAQQQEKPIRHVMVFTRAFRAPLQARFSTCESDALEELCHLLEIADARTRETSKGRVKD